jgi:hypothetical protein
MRAELGNKVRDKVTGFHGTVYAICRYLSGSLDRAGVQTLNTKGELKEEWFDIDRLEIVEE